MILCRNRPLSGKHSDLDGKIKFHRVPLEQEQANGSEKKKDTNNVPNSNSVHTSTTNINVVVQASDEKEIIVNVRNKLERESEKL